MLEVAEVCESICEAINSQTNWGFKFKATQEFEFIVAPEELNSLAVTLIPETDVRTRLATRTPDAEIEALLSFGVQQRIESTDKSARKAECKALARLVDQIDLLLRSHDQGTFKGGGKVWRVMKSEKEFYREHLETFGIFTVIVGVTIKTAGK